MARVFAFSVCTLVFMTFPVGPFTAARIILFLLAFAPIIDVILVNRIEKEDSDGGKLAQNDIS
jgi:hypothetical protein